MEFDSLCEDVIVHIFSFMTSKDVFKSRICHMLEDIVLKYKESLFRTLSIEYININIPFQYFQKTRILLLNIKKGTVKNLLFILKNLPEIESLEVYSWSADFQFYLHLPRIRQLLPNLISLEIKEENRISKKFRRRSRRQPKKFFFHDYISSKITSLSVHKEIEKYRCRVSEFYEGIGKKLNLKTIKFNDFVSYHTINSVCTYFPNLENVEVQILNNERELYPISQLRNLRKVDIILQIQSDSFREDEVDDEAEECPKEDITTLFSSNSYLQTLPLTSLTITSFSRSFSLQFDGIKFLYLKNVRVYSNFDCDCVFNNCEFSISGIRFDLDCENSRFNDCKFYSKRPQIYSFETLEMIKCLFLDSREISFFSNSCLMKNCEITKRIVILKIRFSEVMKIENTIVHGIRSFEDQFVWNEEFKRKMNRQIYLSQEEETKKISQESQQQHLLFLKHCKFFSSGQSLLHFHFSQEKSEFLEEFKFQGNELFILHNQKEIFNRSLRTLDLSKNIPMMNLKDIFSNRNNNIKKLYLNQCELTTIPIEIVNHCKMLEVLDLEKNQISIIPEEIRNLNSLQELFLRENRISQICFLRNISVLEILRIDKNCIRSLDQKEIPQNLKVFSFTSNKSIFSTIISNQQQQQRDKSIKQYLLKNILPTLKFIENNKKKCLSHKVKMFHFHHIILKSKFRVFLGILIKIEFFKKQDNNKNSRNKKKSGGVVVVNNLRYYYFTLVRRNLEVVEMSFEDIKNKKLKNSILRKKIWKRIKYSNDGRLIQMSTPKRKFYRKK